MAAMPDVSELEKSFSRIAAGRDGRHATVVTACVKRLAPATANDAARVDAATPPSAPLRNAEDSAGGRIGVDSQIFAKTVPFHSTKMLR